MNDHIDLTLNHQTLAAVPLRLTGRATVAQPQTQNIPLPDMQRCAEAHVVELMPALQRLGGARSAGGTGELFVVNRQDERRGAALLLHKAGKITVVGGFQHFNALGFDGLG